MFNDKIGTVTHSLNEPKNTSNKNVMD